MMNRRKMAMMISRLLLVSLVPLTVADVKPAVAQTETYSAEANGSQGGRFALVIHRRGDRLTFEMTATARSATGNLPACGSTTLRPDGSFSTYCNGFHQQGRRYQLDGNLNQRTAKIELIQEYGFAQFNLVPGPVPSSARR
jgi:hypothetical protein